MTITPEPEYLTPGEVAVLFRVDPKTVVRWDNAGHLDGVRIIRTPGGHRRFHNGDMRQLLAQRTTGGRP